MAYQVFLSHSSKDKPIADAVCAALEGNGVSCWIAPRDIRPGQDWSEAIVAGLTESPVTVLIFSANANASIQVRREVQRAFEKGKAVIPLRVENILPDGAFEYYLGPVHWLDAITPPLEAHLPTLVETVKRALPVSTAISPAVSVPEAAASVPTPPVPQSNLPAPATPFIGRETELADWLTQLLDPATRVLTLVGFGGMGKTRSALELAHRSLSVMPDGIWWLELEEAHTRDEMIQRIAGGLPIDIKPQPTVKEQLTTWLCDRRLLLVLDNTEQIPEAGIAVNDIVKATAGAKILVTSRRALEIAAEHVIEVPPLPQDQAEALFVNRAQARMAGFAQTAENSDDIRELCRRLEGVPLAIELAASRTAGMTPRDILSRLDEWFRLLQTRAPHLPPRQRAINGTIEWSHELLNDEDKDLFAQLAVFANGFTLAAAESICDSVDVFESVQELRRHSFLRAETHSATQQIRFLMLELVREYAEQKLNKDEVRRSHAEFFLQFATERVVLIRTQEEARALDELSVELGNLRAAFLWAQTRGENELSARLALALYPPLYYRGFWTEARQCLQTGYAASEVFTGALRVLRADLGLRLASLAQDLGDLATAQREAEASLALSQELGHAGGIADALNLLGLIAADQEENETAAQRFQDSLNLRSEEDHPGRAIALHNLARIAAGGGDLAEGRRLYEESLIYRRAAGDARGEAETLGNLGALAYQSGDFAEARRLYYQSLELRRTLRDRQGIALMLYNLAELAERDNDSPRAVGLFVHAERIFHDLQSPFADATAEALRELALLIGDEAFAQARQTAAKTRWEEFAALS